uniref:TIFY motif family protein n=1 Tax=Pohlia nutans TaxID=140635 RepID=A0A4D6QFU7_9BRYO|nr:TIFY motif family protein [Pohlia nutans]
MKGKGHVDDGSGSSLGSTSAGDTVWDPEALYRAMLTRSGLSMLAGTGFHGRSLTGNLGLRFGKPPLHGNENGNGNGIGGSSSALVVEQQQQPQVQPLSPDVIRRLSMDECWRLILELGMRWPAWNGTTAFQTTPGVKKEIDDSTFDGGHHLHTQPDNTQLQEQEFLKRLANRALEALAAQAPRSLHGRVSGARMPAPKQTTPERLAPPPTLPVSQRPMSSGKPPISTQEMPAPKPILTRPRTAEMTIFYDGIVNVSDNVPVDKARIIMMYAEKAGVSAQAEALSQKARFVAPSSGASCQASHVGPSQKDLQDSQASTKVALLAGPSSSVPCNPARSVTPVQSSTFNETLERARAALAQGKAPLAQGKVTVTTQPRQPRPLRQNVMVKPLPNARRNSLARFLDSRKRQSSSEEGSPKKPAIGDGGPSDADDLKGSGKPSNTPLCSQSSKESKETDIAVSNNNAIVDRAPSHPR